MTNDIAMLDRMLLAWNEPDGDVVRRHLDVCLSPEVEFIDPSVVAVGVDAFEANVHEVRGRIPGATYHRTSGVDRHHRLARYAWRIRVGEQIILDGFDVTEFDEDGRVLRVLGFFGPLPAT